MISVQTQIEIQGDLNLASLSRRLDEVNIPREIFRSLLLKLQEEIVLASAGQSMRDAKLASTREPEPRIERSGQDRAK